jgi:hypothetical protein
MIEGTCVEPKDSRSLGATQHECGGSKFNSEFLTGWKEDGLGAKCSSFQNRNGRLRSDRARSGSCSGNVAKNTFLEL